MKLEARRGKATKSKKKKSFDRRKKFMFEIKSNNGYANEKQTNGRRFDLCAFKLF